MSWTSDIWDKSLKIYNAILEQPFIKELAAGTLPADIFARYIAQDEVYLGNYGRQMYELAELMTTKEDHDLFVAFADSGMEGEKMMHELLIDRFGINLDVKGSEVTTFYNNHTQKAIDSGSREIGLAAMMPCMWVYNRVGLHILSIASLEGNPYREWIEEYGNEEFTAGVNSVVEMMDKWAEGVDESTRAAMDEAYLEAALCEFAFWDYGYYGDTKSYDYIKSLKEWI